MAHIMCLFYVLEESNLGLLPDAVVIKEEVNKLADIYFDDVSECFMGCLMIIIYDVPERKMDLLSQITVLPAVK